MKTNAVRSLKDLREMVKSGELVVRELPSVNALPEVVDVDLNEIEKKEREHRENHLYAEELGRRDAVVKRTIAKLSGMKLESEYAKNQLTNAKEALGQINDLMKQLPGDFFMVAIVSSLTNQIKSDTEETIKQSQPLYVLDSYIERAVDVGVIRKMTLADINKARKDGKKYPDDSLLCHIGGYLPLGSKGVSLITELKKLSEAEKAAIVASMKIRATINLSAALGGEEGFIYLYCPKAELSDGKKLPEVHLLLRAKKYKNVNQLRVVDMMGGHNVCQLYRDIKKTDICLPISYIKSGRIDTDDHMDRDDFYKTLIFLSDVSRAVAKETKVDKPQLTLVGDDKEEEAA